MPTSTRRIPVILLQVRALLDARPITIGRRREAVLLILLNQVKSTLFSHFLLVKLLLAVLLLIESTVVRIFERVVGLLWGLVVRLKVIEAILEAPDFDRHLLITVGWDLHFCQRIAWIVLPMSAHRLRNALVRALAGSQFHLVGHIDRVWDLWSHAAHCFCRGTRPDWWTRMATFLLFVHHCQSH